MDYAIRILLEEKVNIEEELKITDKQERREPQERRLISICNALNKLNISVVIGSSVLSDLQWLKDEACVDFLGTGSNGDVAEAEAREWWGKLDKLIEWAKNYL